MSIKKKLQRLPEVLRESRRLMRPYRYHLALGMMLMLVNRAVGLVLPASSKYFIDEVIAKHRAELLPKIALAIGLASIIQAITFMALARVLGVTAQRAITEMRKRVQAHVMRLPVRYFDSSQTGVLLTRIMVDADALKNLVGTELVQMLGGLLTAMLALCVLFYLSWRLTLSLLLIVFVFGVVIGFVLLYLRTLFRRQSQLYSEVVGRVMESLGGIRVIKAYAAEKRQKLAFARDMHALLRNTAKSVTGVSSIAAFSYLVAGLIGVSMILLGGQSILSGSMTLGNYFMYVFFTSLVAGPLFEVVTIGAQLSTALAGIERIREIMRLPTEDEDEKDLEPLQHINGDIRFEDVSFEYDKGVPVLKHISFSAPAGSTTALVGVSGSGKSTLISLVTAFNRPLEGRITVDGRDLATIRLRDYRSQLGVVLQDNFLFDGTIADNISFARPTASRDEIQRASRIAHCEEFVNRLAQGYETVVGERGVKLSGGERQRIAIARAMLADPRVLILDEATSSLDSESETLIQDGLRSLRRGRTTFVIAHRLSTIKSADQILVLEDGEIVERGTHTELLAAAGHYKRLYERQYRSEREIVLETNKYPEITFKSTDVTVNLSGGQIEAKIVS